MKTYAKKRLEVVIEAPVLGRVTRFLEERGVAGYTVSPALSGLGPEGPWSREGQVGDAGRMVTVVCVLSTELKDALLDDLFAMVARQIGYVVISDCEVVRPERF